MWVQKHFSKRTRLFYYKKILRKIKCKIGFCEERLAAFMGFYHHERSTLPLMQS